MPSSSIAPIRNGRKDSRAAAAPAYEYLILPLLLRCARYLAFLDVVHPTLKSPDRHAAPRINEVRRDGFSATRLRSHDRSEADPVAHDTREKERERKRGNPSTPTEFPGERRKTKSIRRPKADNDAPRAANDHSPVPARAFPGREDAAFGVIVHRDSRLL